MASSKIVSKSMTPEAFVLKAIIVLREKQNAEARKKIAIGWLSKSGKPAMESKGIHVIFSGFNEAFKLQFPNLDVRALTASMASEGKIIVSPVKMGAMLYLPDDAPVRDNSARAEANLAAILS